MATNDRPKPVLGTAFGQLLKRLRVAAELTQEELAERAGVSARLISDLERGSIHRPRRDTIQLLADGLRLTGEPRAAFVAIARGAATPDPGPFPGRSPLPVPPTALVGREAELAAALTLLVTPEVRLLTLTGPGGVGKTRLALAVASRAIGAFPQGAVFVDLAPFRDAGQVLLAIAQALDVRHDGDEPHRDRIAAAIRDQRLLLVLDNFERAIDAATPIAELLAACPALTVLATSREPIRIRPEREFPVTPLALPNSRRPPTLADLRDSGAVELFLQRARAIRPDFALADADAPAIAAICRQLEGLPLAIELAASWTRTLDPPTLLARLQPRLPLLTRGARDLPAHQQTMRDCIAWSYDLLAAHEQSLFRCVSVFSGGFTLDAAAFITDRVLSARGPRDAVLDLVASLMDKNLLRWEQSIAGEPRYGMLETIREFGLEQLAGQAELAAARRAHAEHMLALAERAEQELLGPDQVRWLDGLAAEHNNLRVALGWALETGNPDPALRIGTALWRYWTSRGHRREGQTWLECALALERAASPRPRAQALVRLGGLAIDRGDYRQAHDRVAAALQIMRELGDRRGIANCLNDLGVIAADQEDHQRARALHEESLAIRRDLGHRRDLALSLFNLGSVTRDEGDYERAREFYAESLEIWWELGDVSTRAYVHLACGVSARLQGDPTSAAQHARRSLALFREVDDVHGIDSARSELGRLLANEGDNAGAEEQFGAILARIGDGGAEPDTAHNWIEAIEGFGWIALRRDQRPRAAALLAFAAAQRHARGVPFPSPKDRQLHQDAVSLAVLQGGPSWSAAWQSSADRTLDELLNDLFATGDGREAATAPG